VKKLISAIVFTAIVCAPLAAQAGQFYNRIERQERRIYQGAKTGALTPKEYKRLDNRVDNIESARLRSINSGGKFTKVEQHRIDRRLNNTSRVIYRVKHN
jgi:Ni/Co efflux regulator RcnB